MIKQIVFFLSSAIAFANVSKNSNILVNQKFYVVKMANFNNIYNKYLAYRETDMLYNALEKVLNNKKLKNNLYFNEMDKVRVYTSKLIQQLIYFLNGWPKYTNTYFDNNSNTAGLRQILKDCFDNNPQKLNIPVNILNQIENNVNSLVILQKIKELPYTNNTTAFLENLSQIMNAYYLTLEKTNCPIINNFNSKIKNNLEKNYRIYAKTSLIRIIQIFKQYFKQNYQAINN